MAISDKTCYLFTHSFPYGNGEVFLEKEIPFLSAYFKQVVIFPMENAKGDCVKLPSNVRCERLFDANYRYIRRSVLTKSPLLLSRLMLAEFFHHPLITLRQFKSIFSNLLHQCGRAIHLQSFFSNTDFKSVVLYSFWFDRWALILALTKKAQGGIPFRFFSRAHGFEIFKEQTRFGYHPFKWFMLQGVKRVYSVSQLGKNYLINDFPNYSSKIGCSYLGTTGGILTSAPGDTFHIVSCAHVRGIKRLDKVCDILESIPSELRIKWTLLGDGADLELIKQKARNLKSNVTCIFTGYLKPEQILEFYANTPVNLFLSISKSEGLPYTMMEAISFGIPVMATDVGGCKEIVTEQTGILIGKDFDSKAVAGKIMEFRYSDKNTTEFRKGVREFWEKNFSAEKNYFEFYNSMGALSQME